jgi:hypothetical protein
MDDITEYIKRHKEIEKEATGKFREISDEEWDVTSDLIFGKNRFVSDNIDSKYGE